VNKIRLNANIAIADSRFLITEALKSMLAAYGSKVYTVATRNGLDALLRKHEISLIITDHEHFWQGAVDELSVLKQQYPDAAILVLTGSTTRKKIRELNHAGIRNIVMKTDDRAEILHAVRAALAGEKHYSLEVLDLLLKKEGQRSENLLLTPTEEEIVRLIAGGFSVSETAERKHIGVRSVMTHQKNIYRKLGVSGSTELRMFAIRTGMIDNIEYHI
jgi:DNA-binding NarL/FixJ family response regulator